MNNIDNKKYPETLLELDDAIDERLDKIRTEFEAGFKFIKEYHETVTFFGSARTKETEGDYILARSLAKKISTEINYTIITGGSHGIMEAANRGAFEVGGKSVGLNIRLPHEQKTNSYLTDSMNFEYFFIRKVCLTFSAEAFIYFPGGFGTFDELFEILTLIQTGKIQKRPIILFGRDFWNKHEMFIKENLLQTGKISEADLDLYKITDNEDEVIEIIKKAPIRLI